MSGSVSKALFLTGGSEAFETANFVGKVDKFFNSLNVTNFSKGIKSRKPFQAPYYSDKDFVLRYAMCTYFIYIIYLYVLFLNSEFLAYLKSWKASVQARQGFTNAKKKLMMLPSETQDGIHITGIIY